ncbi:MAG: SH3 domain-containing protein [Blastocatellia bacterium]
MSQGTALNNLRVRQQLPRQIDGKRIPFPKAGFFVLPFEQTEEEPRAGREEGTSALAVLAFVFLLMLVVGAGVYYWMSENPAITPNTLAPSVRTTDVRRVDVSELNMREMPNLISPVKFILPQGTPVEVLNEAQQEFDGDVWVKVRVQTREGLQDGWVNARYIR